MSRDYRLALMAGIEIPIPELQLVAHIPTIKDIAYMGEADFFTAVQYLCLEKDQLIQDKNVLSYVTNFQVLMKVIEQSSDREKKSIIKTLLTILFPNYSIAFMPKSIIFAQTGEQPITVMIDDNNFDSFQSCVKEILCVNSIFQGENIIYNPGNDMAKRIADKLMKGRRKAAALKSKGNNDSVLVRYISILTTAKIVSLQECLNYNLFQIFDLMERYSAYVEWDIDLKVRLAGGKPDKQVESWMRDLHSQS